MRVLLVEDSEQWSDAIESGSSNQITFEIARTRDYALRILDTSTFDLVVCDMRIPPTEGALSGVEHGLAVLTSIRARSSGTPIIAFTAYKTAEVLDVLVREQSREDFVGDSGERLMLDAMEKDELPEFLGRLDELRKEFETLDAIEIVMPPGADLPDELTCRIFRIFARRKNAAIIRVSPFSAGNSGVAVWRVALEREDGSAGGLAVARIASISDVRKERLKFQQRVSGSLPMGAYAEIVGMVLAGAGGMGAVFYQLADGAISLFEMLSHLGSRASEVVNTLSSSQEPWRTGSPAKTLRVSDVRRILISDMRWQQTIERLSLNQADMDVIEGVELHVRMATAHCDLHGENVLIANSAVIIDFESVTDAPSPLDAVSLELSSIFHPGAPFREGAWPTPLQLRSWWDLDVYLEGCPNGEFIRSCRTWALNVARTNKEILACAWAYGAFQAKFTTTDTVRIMSLLEGIGEKLRMM